jgi:hypothetical protein
MLGYEVLERIGAPPRPGYRVSQGEPSRMQAREGGVDEPAAACARVPVARYHCRAEYP